MISMWGGKEIKGSLDYIPIIDTTVEFEYEGIDAVHKLLNAGKLERDNINKIRQLLGIFHNFNITSKEFTSIQRVKDITKGVDSLAWIEDNIKSYMEGNVFSNGLLLAYAIYDIENNKGHYIIFRYLLTILNQSINIYYKIGRDTTDPRDTKKVSIKIITPDYLFEIVRINHCVRDVEVHGEVMDITLDSKVTISAIRLDKDKELLIEEFKHPLEIIKMAYRKLNYLDIIPLWDNATDLETELINNHFIENRSLKEFIQDYFLIDKEARYIIRQDTWFLIKLFHILFKETLYDFKKYNIRKNCIGFTWTVEDYNIIIDEDIENVYILKEL